jgi:hypothetical protein
MTLSMHVTNPAKPVNIECTKEGVKFSCTGDIGSGSVTLRQHTNVDKEDLNVDIQLSEPVSLTFSLKYLVNFCKASGLSARVKLCLSTDVPLMVEYSLASNSYLRFYLAPKVSRRPRVPTKHKLTCGRLATRSRIMLPSDTGQEYGMTWCSGVAMIRFGEESHGAIGHAVLLTQTDDIFFYYTKFDRYTVLSHLDLNLCFFDDPVCPFSRRYRAYLLGQLCNSPPAFRHATYLLSTLDLIRIDKTYGRGSRNSRFGSRQPCKTVANNSIFF